VPVLSTYASGAFGCRIRDYLNELDGDRIAFNRIRNSFFSFVAASRKMLTCIWHADEMMVSVDGDWFYLWNIMYSILH